MPELSEVRFAQILGQVRKLAKEQGNCISEEQVQDAFAELSLSDDQLSLVYDYLKKHKVGIGEPVDLDDYLTDGEMDYLEAYRKEIMLFGEISEGEKEAMILSAMAGEKASQERLIRFFLPKVADVARLYAGQGVFLEDLIGEGNVALTLGVTMLGAFEHAKEAEGALMQMVMDAMERHIQEAVEEAEKDKKAARKVNQVADKARELAGELHRKVTAAELSEETGMSERYIEDAMRMSGFAIEDLEKNP
ncbi:MAG: hypothetical protein K2P07_04720 [Lachnospiraceae bacterium]|nr:hypothetical protein [Lachnospiraceae bacterium]